MKTLPFIIVLSIVLGMSCSVNLAEDMLSQRQAYRLELEQLRKEFGGTQEMPDITFFLFGMGQRTKLIYRKGKLLGACSGKTLHEWPIKAEVIVPDQYTVYLTCSDNSKIKIREDQTAVWIEEKGTKTAVQGTTSPLRLPEFHGHQYSRILKTLHHEILINIIDGKPVPNFLVYSNPWRRDGAMMAMCLEKSGNLNLIKKWVLNLVDPYDRNNQGETEADNLGQTLYLLSLFTDSKHPLVSRILNETTKYEIKDGNGLYIKGRSDFHEVPAYQTKWLKFGLKNLKLPDPYVIPGNVEDNYSALFWWDYKDTYKPGTKDAWEGMNYPYLEWAVDHFHGQKKGVLSNRDYPLTWEKEASQAKYEGMKLVDDIFVTQKLSMPHTWHAAEVFLYLWDIR
jgi:hypothetical protein